MNGSNKELISLPFIGHMQILTLNTRTIGALVGQLTGHIGITEKSECVEFSFGVHACGFEGEWLKEHRGRILASCTGFDPVSHQFEGYPQFRLIDPSDLV